MKLLLISVRSEKSRGGIAVWTDRFLLACKKREIVCDVVNTEALGKRRENGSASRNLFDEFYRTRRIFKDLKASLKTEYDTVHLNTSCGTFGLFRDYLIARKVKRKKIKLVTHYHCDIPYWIHRSISRGCLKKLAALSDENLVLCENSRSFLENTVGIKATILPNFVDDDLIIKNDKAILDSPKKVTFVGGITREKGAAEIYEIAKSFPNLLFELIGNVSDEVSTWGTPENIILAGSMDHNEVIKRLDGADIFLFPSHTEGFSLALTEAMARGIPSIATDVGANEDMLDDGCGIVVSKGDIEGMKNALRTLHSTDARRDVSKKARNKVRDSYTEEKVMEILLQKYGIGERKSR